MIGFALAAVLLLPLGGLVSAFCYGGLLFSLRPALPATGRPPGHRQPAAPHAPAGPGGPAGEQPGELAPPTSAAPPETPGGSPCPHPQPQPRPARARR
jgi:hypothetical protein